MELDWQQTQFESFQYDPRTLSDSSPETDENRTYLIKIYLREMLLESFLFLSFFKLIP